MSMKMQLLERKYVILVPGEKNKEMKGLNYGK